MEEAGTGKDVSPTKNCRRVVCFCVIDYNTLHQRAACNQYHDFECKLHCFCVCTVICCDTLTFAHGHDWILSKVFDNVNKYLEKRQYCVGIKCNRFI